MGKGISTDNYEEAPSFDVIPAGEYTLSLVKSERKTSKSNSNNEYLNCQFTVVGDTKYKGRVIFHIFNLQNDSSTAQDISTNQLKGLLLATGVKSLSNKWDLTSIMNKPVQAKVTIQKQDAYPGTNKISSFVVGKKKKTSGIPAESAPWDTDEKKKKKKKKKGKKKK